MRGTSGRATVGVIGIALVLVVALALSMQARQHDMDYPSIAAPPQSQAGSTPDSVGSESAQSQNSAYTSQNSQGTFHLAVVASYNLADQKPGQFLFIYAMKSNAKGTPNVTAKWEPGSPETVRFPFISIPTAVPTSALLSSSRPSATPSSVPTIVSTSTLKIINIQPLGEIAEFSVGAIHAEWADPANRALVLTVLPPGGADEAWRVRPFVDMSYNSLDSATSVFKNSPPEIEQVSVACPCGPDAFRLAILGRPTENAQPIILGIGPDGAVALMTEQEYFRRISPNGTPWPTEDTEHVQIAPTYPPTATVDPEMGNPLPPAIGTPVPTVPGP